MPTAPALTSGDVRRLAEALRITGHYQFPDTFSGSADTATLAAAIAAETLARIAADSAETAARIAADLALAAAISAFSHSDISVDGGTASMDYGTTVVISGADGDYAFDGGAA